MASVTLSWLSININGQETSNVNRTAFTCGWTGPRCDIHIRGSYTIDIDIQVELEVVNVAYSSPRNSDGRAMMIFLVMINRPCLWAANNKKTWHETIGVKFDTKAKTWTPAQYQKLYKALHSCFSDPDNFQKMSISDMEQLWSNISAHSASPINRSKFTIFQGLTVQHLNRLKPEEWLDDELVNSGIKQWLLVEHLHPDHSVYAMPTFFYRLWSFEHGGYDRVKRWLNVDKLLSTQHILVPININDNHWILAIIAVPEKCLESDDHPIILAILDSLARPNSHQKVADSLGKWLTLVCAEKSSTKPKIVTVQAKVPHQPNFHDCGVYVLHFVRVFLSDPVFFTQYFQQPQEDANLDDIWKMDKLESLRQDFLLYIKTVELAAER